MALARLGSGWSWSRCRSQGSQDCEVDGPHLRGGWVFIVPGLEKGSQLVDVSGAIHSGIREVQLGKLLAHGM